MNQLIISINGVRSAFVSTMNEFRVDYRMEKSVEGEGTVVN